jgi:hypothetical protein
MVIFFRVLSRIVIPLALNAGLFNTSYLNKINGISANSKFDTVEISGLWVRKSYYDRETKMLSGASLYCFLLTNQPDTIRIKHIVKYINDRNITNIVLNWNAEAGSFFATFSEFPEWKKIYQIKKPYEYATEGSKRIKYKKDWYYVCEYKLRCIKRTMAKEDFRMSIFLGNYHDYNDADSINIYLEIERLYRKPW